MERSTATRACASRSHDFTFAWTGSEVFVWGGYGLLGRETYGPHDDGALYDPATDSWRPITRDGAPPAAQMIEAA